MNIVYIYYINLTVDKAIYVMEYIRRLNKRRCVCINVIE